MLSRNRLFAGVFVCLFLALCGQAAFAHKVELDIKCEGERHDAKVIVRWGYPKHEEHSQTIEVKHGDGAHETLDVPDHSELEIRTEGGRGTRYEIKAVVADKGAFSIVFDHGEKNFDSDGKIDIKHSSGPSDTGEMNIRVHVK